MEHDGKEGTHKDEWLGGWCPNLPSRPLFWPDPTETKGPPRPPPRTQNREIWLSEWQDRVTLVTDRVQPSDTVGQLRLGVDRWLFVRCQVTLMNGQTLPSPGATTTVKGVLSKAIAGEGILLEPCILDSESGPRPPK